MSSRQDNDLWRRVEDAVRPSAEELAHTEQELAATKAKALPAGKVERIVSEATGADAPRLHAAGFVPTTCDATDLPARRGKPARLLMAAAASFCMLSLAWVGTRVIWPNAPMPLQAELQEAIDIATSPEAAKSEWRRAMLTLARNCTVTVSALTALQLDEDRDVANAAQAAFQRLAVGTDGPGSPSADHRVDDLVDLANAGTTPQAKRIDAIGHLEHLTAASLAAIREASLTTSDSATFRGRLLKRIAARLADVQPPRTY